MSHLPSGLDPDDDRPDTRDMIIIHRLFRREFQLLGPMVGHTAAGDTARAQQIAGHAVLVLNFLDNHHHGEDELLWPLLSARAGSATQALQRMESQHEAMAAAITAIRARLATWTQSASPEDRDTLSNLFDQLHPALVLHLDEEERHILPLARKYLSVAEWGKLAEHGQAATPRQKTTALMLLGAIIEDAGPNEAAQFLSTVPLPGRIAWRTIGKRRYRAYTTALRSHH